MRIINQAQRYFSAASFIIVSLYRITILYICRLFPIKNNRVYFDHFNGDGYGDNPRYVAEALHNLYGNERIEYIWTVNENKYEAVKSVFPSWIHAVIRCSIRDLYYMATSRVWVCNSRKYSYARKRNGQYYIQTWHGGLGLKKIEGDASNYSRVELYNAKNDSRMIDLLVSNSTHLTNIFKRAFWYDGEIIELGMPNCDKLLNHKFHSCHLREQLQLPEQSKLLIYAPTFRDNIYFSFDIDIDRMRRVLSARFGEDDIRVLVRMHPKQKEALKQFSINDYIIDATDFPDMNELLLDCDYMITDYSSCMFPMSYMHKPVWIYATDIQEYISNERGFYYRLDELPFTISTNNDELASNITLFNDRLYRNKLSKYFEQVGLKESGQAAVSVAKIIHGKIHE